jgi:6-phosphogluconolactonase (cycloisomerase 2 family)
MGKYFMMTLLARSGLQVALRAFSVTRILAVLGLAGLLTACGGGGGGDGGGGSPPPAATLSSIAVTASSMTVAAGLTQQFAAMGTYSDSSKKDITSTVTWTSSATATATISSAGLATGVAAGTSTISAALSGVTGQATLTVTAPGAPTLTAIAVTPSSTTVAAGLTQQFTAMGTYSDSTQHDITSTVTWDSTVKSSATISTAGLATALAAGTSTSITATLSGITGQTTLTVSPPNLTGIVISPNKPVVAVNKTVQFSAIATYSDGSTQDVTSSVTWSSTVTEVATIVSTTGLATAGTHIGTGDILATKAGGPAIAPVHMSVSATIYAYATNFDDSSVSQYVLDATTGALSPLATPKVAAGNNPFSISVEPSGEYVYVSNWLSNSVSQYRIGDNGSLSPIGTGTVTVGLQPNAVTIDHANRFAYVTNLGESTISQFKIGLDGALAPLSGPPVATGTNPATLIVDPTNKFAYVGNFGANAANPPAGPGTISQYSIGADGSLTPNTVAATVVSGSGPNSMAIDPTGKYLYVANLGDNNLGQYTINPDGTLVAMLTPTVATGVRPFGVTIHPTGKFVYVANSTDNTISQYSVNTTGPAIGGLTPITAAIPAGNVVSSVAVDPTGNYLYATNRGDQTVSQYKINADGSLTAMVPIATVGAGVHPTAIAIGY